MVRLCYCDDLKCCVNCQIISGYLTVQCSLASVCGCIFAGLQWHPLLLEWTEQAMEHTCFGSGIDPVSLIILFFLGRSSRKKPKAPLFQLRSGWNLPGSFFKQICIVWQSWIP